MPKNREVAEQLRQQRIEKQKKESCKTNSASPNIYLQILGNGCPGGPRSVFIFTDTVRYLFNCGEGTQKLCQENKIKMPKTKHLFFTSPSWENIGGLLGYLLTLQDTGVPELQIHGHESIMELFKITRSFTNLDLIHLNRFHGLEFRDEVMTIRYVVLNKGNDEQMESKRVRLDDEVISNDAVISYICQAHPKPGKLSPQRCAEMGVPAGPLFAELKAGKDVTLEDGRVVKPADVLGEGERSPIFIILECPSEQYLDSIITATEFQSLQSGSQKDLVSLIVHMTPKKVYESAKYQTFLSRFPPNLHNILLCEENSYELSVAAYRAQYRLNLIHDEVFPLLPRCEKSDGVVAFTKYSIRPHDGVDLAAAISIHPQEYIDEARSSPNFDAVLSQLKRQLQKVDSEDSRQFPSVTFLGTGSAIPSKDRNVSAILMTIKPDTYLLLDCGESTWSQIIRHYGTHTARNILRGLKCVYISHMHADHHLGLITILKERVKLGAETNLRIVGPPNLFIWLNNYNEVLDRINFDFIPCASLLKCSQEFATAHDTLNDFGIDHVSTCLVVHCKDAYGIRVDIGGYSVVYSGDTRPAESLVELGKDCDLLIHEATMETGLEEDAETKAHCTTAQAIEIGRRMNAKFTLLTHFSQRYCKLPNVDEAIFNEGRVGCAFDHMEVSPKHLRVLPHIYPMLKCLFAEHYYQMCVRTMASNKVQVSAQGDMTHSEREAVRQESVMLQAT